MRKHAREEYWELTNKQRSRNRGRRRERKISTRYYIHLFAYECTAVSMLVVVTKHALKRMTERWRISQDQAARTLTEVLKNGTLMGKEKNVYLIQHGVYVVILKREDKTWYVVTATGPNIPVSWMHRSLSPKRSPLSGGSS